MAPVIVPPASQGIINDAAAKTGLPRSVVAAQVGAESSFRPGAVSPAGAQGEFQFMPGTFKSQGTGGSPFNPSDAERAYVKYMSSLLRAEHGNVRLALAAYNAGPGNIQAGLGYADKILGQAGTGRGVKTMPGRSRLMTFNIPGAKIGSDIGGGLNTEALAAAVLAKEASKPIDTSGKVHAGSALGDLVGAVDSGLYNAPVQHATSQLPNEQITSQVGAAHGSLRTTGLAHITGRGSNINPLEDPNWNIGRTDMGVDAGARPGTPIKAINDSVVKQIVPNWFRGQPLVLMQLTSGPDAGKYWYVSEQIAQVPHVGQQIQRGQTVAVFAPQGTGIEIGWGSPSTNSRTAAGPHYTEGAVTPEGADFRKRVLGH